MQKNLKYLCLSGIFAALIFAVTMLHIPAGNGYIHMGDAVIFLCASILPQPFALGAAAIGGGLSDLISGYPMWILPTVIIKALITLSFKNSKRIFTPRNMLACITALIISVGGYFTAEMIIYNTPQAVLSIPANVIQIVISVVVYTIVGLTIDKIKRVPPLG
ncbi:MAG: TIGR04002 family protein [Ruminococcus sp.]|jgi:uncharacterized repeat protein (TIGR04002 family)|nr:TIGR04002 family protein [Ruminococcus sp.]